MTNPFSLANTIILLAFTEFLQSGTEESSRQLTDSTLLGLNDLRQQILSRLQGESAAKAIVSIIGTQSTLVPDQLQPLVPALAAVMQADFGFANRISQLANAISQEPGVSNLLGQNIQSVASGTGTQVNDPNAPTFTGSVSSSTFNIYYGGVSSSQTSSGSGLGSTSTAATRRLELFDTLASLPNPQFEQVIFALKPPPGNIPSAFSPQGTRVKPLLDWAETIGPGLNAVEEVCTRVVSPQKNLSSSPQTLIEHYLRTDSAQLESVEIQKIEQALQSPDLDGRTLAQGCLLLRREKGLDLVINQLDWIYELAEISDGRKPRHFLPRPKPTGRLTSINWMKARLNAGLPGDYSYRIAQTLGSLGIFIPEMVPSLQFLFTNPKYADQERDEALVYLGLIGTSEVLSILIKAVDTSESEDYYLYSRGLFGLLLIDNVNVLAKQIRKALPESDLNTYAYGLAGSRDPQGRVLLETMKNYPNEHIRTAIKNAFNRLWISAPGNASSIVASEARGLLSNHQTEQIRFTLNLMESFYVDDWKLCFLTSNQHLALYDLLIKTLSSGDKVAQRKAIKAIYWLMGTTLQEQKKNSGLTLGKQNPLWFRSLSSEKIQEIEKFLQGQNLDPQILAEGCLTLTREEGLNPVFTQVDWIYKLAVIADGTEPRRHLLDPKPTGRSASVDWMKKLLSNGFPPEWSCWVAQTLGSFGVFIPEMIRPLTFLFTNQNYAEKDRDEALVYLAMIDVPQVIPILVGAADLISTQDDYFSSRGLFGLLLFDNANVLAEQILKVPPYDHLSGYAYGLAGSRDPRGQAMLGQMRRHSNKNIRAAVEAAIAAPWIN
ncbi:hypothetical protein [Nostoc sp.]|uniref:hypothetical protein n=1 Tax=Nostoc sp. TaxID=1180 RepID=UPI002FF90F8E